MENLELRTVSRPLELRKDGETLILEGYGAVFYRDSDPDGTQFRLWGNTFERIMPGAFDEALQRPDDVRCLFNHDVNILLGRSESGTLKLSVDAIGLRFACQLPDDEDGRRVASKIQRGDVSGCSFGFIADKEKTTWREVGDTVLREVGSVRLYDVGPVTYPAYKGTEVSVAKRSYEDFTASHRSPRTLAGLELSRQIQKLT
jgi:HK97 family phage prohead protease